MCVCVGGGGGGAWQGQILGVGVAGRPTVFNYMYLFKNGLGSQIQCCLSLP